MCVVSNLAISIEWLAIVFYSATSKPMHFAVYSRALVIIVLSQTKLPYHTLFDKLNRQVDLISGYFLLH